MKYRILPVTGLLFLTVKTRGIQTFRCQYRKRPGYPTFLLEA